jgi:hypothetical protein
LRDVTSIPCFSNDFFIKEGMIDIPKGFFSITTNHVIFPPLFWLYVVLSLFIFIWSIIALLEWSQTDHVLLIIHKFSFKHFTENFCIYVHQGNWPIIFCLLCDICFVFRVILASYNVFSLLTSLLRGIV